LVDVVKEYAGTPPLRVLHGVNLTIDPGELLAVVGPSGSGKSTLLALMGTLDRPTSGSVRLDGHEIGGLSEKRLTALRASRIGFVFQQFFLLNGLSALDNVASGLLYTGERSLRVRRERAAEALEMVGLGHRMKHRPPELSGGEQQRVAIARALVGRPALVLADEPTGALDSQSGAAVVELMRDLNAAGTTIAVITHDRELAAALPRQVGIRDGRVEFDTRTGVAA
jgi:putative ABC transport system ATP-binding protein